MQNEYHTSVAGNLTPDQDKILLFAAHEGKGGEALTVQRLRLGQSWEWDEHHDYNGSRKELLTHLPGPFQSDSYSQEGDVSPTVNDFLQSAERFLIRTLIGPDLVAPSILSYST